MMQQMVYTRCMGQKDDRRAYTENPQLKLVCESAEAAEEKVEVGIRGLQLVATQPERACDCL